MSHNNDTEMLASAPDTVRQFFEHDSKRNIDAIVALFTPDAVVIDEGETRHGTEEILSWQTGAASAWEYTTTVTSVHATGENRMRVVAHLDGNFPGGTVDLNFDFTIDDDLISRLEIAP